MPVVMFTPQLRRFTETAEVQTDACTLRTALEAAFGVNPRLRGYVLDDQGHLRPNVVVFVDGRRSTDRLEMHETVAPQARRAGADRSRTTPGCQGPGVKAGADRVARAGPEPHRGRTLARWPLRIG